MWNDFGILSPHLCKWACRVSCSWKNKGPFLQTGKAPLGSRVLQHWTLDPCWEQQRLTLAAVDFSPSFLYSFVFTVNSTSRCFQAVFDFRAALFGGILPVTLSSSTSPSSELRIVFVRLKLFFQTLLSRKTNLDSLQEEFLPNLLKLQRVSLLQILQQNTLHSSLIYKRKFFILGAIYLECSGDWIWLRIHKVFFKALGRKK